MSEVVRRYLEILDQRRLARSVVRGELTTAEEARFVGVLDECWYKMTEEEHELVNSILAGRT